MVFASFLGTCVVEVVEQQVGVQVQEERGLLGMASVWALGLQEQEQSLL